MIFVFAGACNRNSSTRSLDCGIYATTRSKAVSEIALVFTGSGQLVYTGIWSLFYIFTGTILFALYNYITTNYVNVPANLLPRLPQEAGTIKVQH